MSEISQEAICSLNDQLYKRRVKDWGHGIKNTQKYQNDMQIFSLCGIAIAMAADLLLSRDLKFASQFGFVII